MRRFIILSCAPLLFFLFSNAFAHKDHAVVEDSKEVQSAVSDQPIVYPEVVKLHPPAVHFAIALPLFALLLGGFYSIKRREPDDIEFLAIFLSSTAVIGASITGYIAHESMENLPITKSALDLLHTHENLGIALASLFALILLLRFIYMFKRLYIIHHLYMLLLLGGVIAVFIQGNLGGKLVYDFGLGVSR